MIDTKNRKIKKQTINNLFNHQFNKHKKKLEKLKI